MGDFIERTLHRIFDANARVIVADINNPLTTTEFLAKQRHISKQARKPKRKPRK